MRRICVFCGSSAGSNPAYAKGAVELGKVLADQAVFQDIGFYWRCRYDSASNRSLFPDMKIGQQNCGC